MNPFRSPPARRSPPHDAGVSLALLPGLALLWWLSVARVVGGLVRGEDLGGEASLACLALVALPWLARDGLRELARRVRDRRGRGADPSTPPAGARGAGRSPRRGRRSRRRWRSGRAGPARARVVAAS